MFSCSASEDVPQYKFPTVSEPRLRCFQCVTRWPQDSPSFNFIAKWPQYHILIMSLWHQPGHQQGSRTSGCVSTPTTLPTKAQPWFNKRPKLLGRTGTSFIICATPHSTEPQVKWFLFRNLATAVCLKHFNYAAPKLPLCLVNDSAAEGLMSCEWLHKT